MTQGAQARVLAVLTTVAVVFALRAARPVALPLAFALFLIAVLWPVQERLQRRLRPGLAFALTLAGFSAVLWLFGWTLAESVDAMVERWPRYQPRFEDLAGRARQAAMSWGIPLQQGEQGGGQLVSWLESSARTLVSTSAGMLLTLALMVLGLLEVQQFRDKLRRGLSTKLSGQMFEVARQSATRFGRYFGARTVMSLIQGVTTGLFAWAVGLDLAFVWGVQSALLNYVPTIGSVLAVIPPALFAVVQFPGFGKAALVIAGLAGMQVVLGNYVDPRIQGRWLSLSPFVVLLSITFWGWVWGPAGALIGVPLTIAIVIVCQQRPNLRGVAVLLSSPDADIAPEPEPAEAARHVERRGEPEAAPSGRSR